MKLESEEATIKGKLETQEAAVKEAEGGFKLSENRKLEILEASQKHQVKNMVLLLHSHFINSFVPFV